MKIYVVNGRLMDKETLDNIATYMDDEKREQVHFELAPCTPDEFFERYLELDADFLESVKYEFAVYDMETGDTYEDPEGTWRIVGRTETQIEIVNQDSDPEKSYLVSCDEVLYYLYGI